MAKLPDWSELPRELLVSIVRRINLIEDYLTFGIVCKSWHSVANKGNFNSELPRVPWLMLAEKEKDDNGSRNFFSLYNGMILNKRIPKASGKRCMESLGWLVMVGKDDGEISLLHPFSGVEIELPHRNTSKVRKAVLSASPSLNSDYVLMVIEGPPYSLCFWRPGDLSWTKITKQNAFHHFSDLVYLDGKFYAVEFNSSVYVCDVSGPKPTLNSIVARLPLWFSHGMDHLYLLESLGSLFVVVQDLELRYKGVRKSFPQMLMSNEIFKGKTFSYGSTDFQVYRADLAAGKMTQTRVRDIGDRSFFLGMNSSLSVQASQFPGIKPNHIYFTDSCLKGATDYEDGSLDMGVFNIADRNIHPHYEGSCLGRSCPPIWVTPTLY